MTATLADETKMIALQSGVALPYVERGDATGVPTILLHGLSDSWHSFELLLPHLPPSLRAFALTQRGHGDADRPQTGYTPGDFAADVAAFVDALGLGPVIVVGHSMGATVAQQFAIDYPDRTLGVVLIGSFARFAGNPAIAELWAAVESFVDPIDPAFAQEFQEATLAQPIPPFYLATVVSESLKMPARVWKAALAGLVETDLSLRLHTIAAPTLIIWGDQDAFVPRDDQDLLAEIIPNARRAVYTGAGHAVHWEDPARFAAELAIFAGQIAGRR